MFEDLGPRERELLKDWERDNENYGLLRSEKAVHTTKVVSKDVALLFLTLRSPRSLPTYFSRLLGADAERTVQTLIFDGVLEVEQEGQFQSGPTAMASPPRVQPVETEGTLDRLSRLALHYGFGLQLTNPGQLSARLYFYNRSPVSPRWQRELSEKGDLERFLGFDVGSPVGKLLRSQWRELEVQPQTVGWRRWASRDGRKRRLPYKLYLSPQTRVLPSILGEVLAVLKEHEAQHFKFGADIAGLQRPDKFVVYAESKEQLLSIAQALAERLSGVAAAGVPFTAPVLSNGLLSWGMDPPAEKEGRETFGGQSWRIWVCERLARALVLGASLPEAECVERALARLQLEGVDTTTWTPKQGIWSEIQQGNGR